MNLALVLALGFSGLQVLGILLSALGFVLGARLAIESLRVVTSEESGPVHAERLMQIRLLLDRADEDGAKVPADDLRELLENEGARTSRPISMTSSMCEARSRAATRFGLASTMIFLLTLIVSGIALFPEWGSAPASTAGSPRSTAIDLGPADTPKIIDAFQIEFPSIGEPALCIWTETAAGRLEWECAFTPTDREELTDTVDVSLIHPRVSVSAEEPTTSLVDRYNPCVYRIEGSLGNWLVRIPAPPHKNVCEEGSP
jgi:hypothetical protein